MNKKLGKRLAFILPLASWVTERRFLVAWLLFFLVSLALSISRAGMPFLSQWDELYHLSYVQYAFQGTIPAPGFPMNEWAKTAFSCYPVSLLGMTTDVPCGEIGAGSRYPTGGTNTAAVWPPIYYLLTAALLWPIKFIIGVSDNLFAARYATALIWAAGTSLLSLLVYKKSKSFLLGATFALLSTAFSLFGQSASFVSPHSSVPLLIFIGLVTVFWLERRVDDSLKVDFWKISNWKSSLKSLLSWFSAIFGYGLLVSLTVPHAIPIIIVFAIYIFAGIWSRHFGNLRKFTLISLLSGAMFAASALGFLAARSLWTWQMSIRTVPWPSDVNPDAADVDALGSYPDIIRQLMVLWWYFWPNGLRNPWLQGEVAIFVENFWIFLLPTLIISAIATLGIAHWLKRLALGLVVASPLASNLAFSTLQIAIPERYGMAIVLLGLFGLASDYIRKSFQTILFLGAIATYILSYFYSPLPFNPAVCPSMQISGALGCIFP